MTLASATAWDTRYHIWSWISDSICTLIAFRFTLTRFPVHLRDTVLSCVFQMFFLWFSFRFRFFFGGIFSLGILKSATFNTDEIQMRNAGGRQQAAWLSNYELRIDIIVRLFIGFMRDFRALRIA